MKIIKAYAYSGPNVVAPTPLVHLCVEIAGPQSWPADDTGRACAEALLQLLPGLAGHPGRSDEPNGFVAELCASPGLPLGYVVARVATELQRRYDGGIRLAGMHRKAGQQITHIFFRYDDPDIGLLAGQAAINIVLSLLPPEARPANRLPDGLGPEQVLAAFLRRKKTMTLDQTAIALIREAERHDIPWFVLDRAKRMVQLGQGRHLRRICETITSTTSHIATVLQNDKSATNRILSEVLLPVPRQLLVQDVETAVQAARQIGYPVVVKPVDSKKGRGITLLLEEDDAVRSAFARACRYSRYVLVESYIAGDDHRVLVVGGRMIAASNRVPGAVTGDGRSTIAELVAKLNEDPNRGPGFTRLMTYIELDDQADIMLGRRGYSRDSVPPEGDVVYLRGTANISTGGTAIDVTDRVHPVNRLMLERTARVMGLDVAGIDFITPDITRPYREVRGAICEVNASPGLRPHLAVETPPEDVVGAIIDSLFPESRNGRIPTAAITGTNGKTTTSTMLAHILRHGGGDIGVRVVGLASTNGVFIDDERIVKGDLAGVQGAKILLRDPSVEAAVLETARGGMTQHGLVVDWCDVGAVLNVTDDHIGVDGIGSLDEMATIKGRVIEAARKLAVLNADDPRCLAMATLKAAEQVCLVSAGSLNQTLRDHLAKGGLVINLEEQDGGPTIVLHSPAASEAVVPVKQIPSTLGGAAKHNIQNAMFAAGLAYGLGISRGRIAETLSSYESTFESNPGRFNVFDGLPFTVVLDFAHNPDGARAACDTVRHMEITGRRICILGCIGHRHGEHIGAVTDIVADQFDSFICTRNKRISEEREAIRGFPSEEIPTRLAASLIERGVDSSKVLTIDHDKEALEKGLQMAKAGDLLLVFLDDKEWSWDHIGRFRK